MKKILSIVFVLVTLCLILPNASFADLSANAISHVYVTVDPNVAVAARQPVVNAGSVQMGDFTASLRFRIDANLQMVDFSVRASDLYKANDALGIDVPPIPLAGAGVMLQPDNGNPTGGASNTLLWTTSGGDVAGYPTTATQQKQYESSQNNHFSQDVVVTVGWNQGDPEKPTGEYSGVVELTAMVMP